MFPRQTKQMEMVFINGSGNGASTMLSKKCRDYTKALEIAPDTFWRAAPLRPRT